MADGPRAVRAPELDELSDLVDSIFGGRDDGSMFEQFPRLFHPERLEQMRVVAEAGRLAAHVGMLLEPACLLGCETILATIGAVCCRPECRGRGHATALMDDCLRRARAAGATVMLISGGRGLYRRLGAQNAGRFPRYRLEWAQVPGDTSMTASRVVPGHTAELRRLYEGEPIRWHRDATELDLMLACGVVQCRVGSTHVIRHGGEPVAAVTVSRRREQEPSRTMLQVCEMAGSREAVFRSLPGLAAGYSADGYVVQAYETDWAWRDLAASRGFEPTWTRHEGTVRVLDLPRLLGDFAPLLADRLGADRARLELTLEDRDRQPHRLRASGFGQELALEGAGPIAELLFGTTGEHPLAGHTGQLADCLRAALPIPLPSYGLNYA